MNQDIFTDVERRQISEHGLTQKEVFRQLDLFRTPRPYLKLVRPCTKGNGIRVIDSKQTQELVETYERNIFNRRYVKFVPASGAASRMFKLLLKELGKGSDILLDLVEEKVQSNSDAHSGLLHFMKGIRQFAFFEDLKSMMAEKGFQIDGLIEEGRFTEIVSFLLTESGLNYSNLPKGLLKFHAYADGARTAFEEHLVEAVSYAADKDGQCHLHFTVSPEHMARFRSLLEAVKPKYENKYQASFQVDFSVQKESTDTIAVDMNNNPVRVDNRLVFRPGGHGALIENVNDLKGDIVFIKNIDNVVPDRLKDNSSMWKKILGGCLMTLQTRIFDYLEKLSSGLATASFIDIVTDFLKKELSVSVPPSLATASSEERTAFISERLNRPIRVCGMVKNEGEPGGGPFWVQDRTGDISPQIVESAQIDPHSREQQHILSSATHFNPVDLVCGVRDWQGEPFDLRRYVDEDTVFISRKSKDGQDLKALEHPGLWNGAMARWITVFVEVPISTFNPVKKVNDLLRKEHQPE